MADRTASFAVDVDVDDGGTAEATAKALEELRQTIKDDQGELRELKRAMKDLQGGSAVNIAAFKQLRDTIEAKKNAIASARQQYIQLGGSFSKASSAAVRTSKDIEDLGGSLDEVAAANDNLVRVAGSSERALEELRTAIRNDREELRGLNDALSELQGGSSVSRATFKQLRDRIKEKKNAIAAAREQYIHLGGSFKDIADSGGRVVDRFGDMLDVSEAMGGETSELAGRVKQLREALSGASGLAAGIAIVIVAAVALAGIAVYAAASLVSYGLAAADSARSSRLLAEAAIGSAGGVAAYTQAVDIAAQRSAVARSKLNEMALGMTRAGLHGETLKTTLSAAAVAASVLGDGAASKIQGIAAASQKAGRFIASALDLEAAGVSFDSVASQLATQLGVSFAQARAAITSGTVSVDDGLRALDAAVQARFGDIAGRQLLSFEMQLQRASEAASELFSDVKIEPFLRGLHSVLGLLDDSTIAGRGLKAIAEGMLNPLMADLGALAPLAKGLFKGMVIGALMFTIAALKTRNALKEVFGGDTASSARLLEIGVYAGVAAFAAMVTVAGAVAAVFGVVVLAIKRIYDGVVFVVGSLAFLTSAFVQAYSFISGLDFGSIATSLIDGLVQGITAGASRVVAAFEGIAERSIKALRAKFKINSPAGATKEITHWAGEGFIEQGKVEKKRVARTFKDMIELPTRAQQKSAAMVSLPARKRQQQPQPAARVEARASGDRYLTINIYDLPDADRLREPSFLDKLIEAVESTEFAAA